MNDKSYNNWPSMNDQALVQQIGNYVRHHRMEQHKSQHQLSIDAGISRSTLSLLERGETVTIATLIQVLRSLDKLHIMNAFIVDTTPSPLALARLERKKRKRARSVKSIIQNTDTETPEW
jgi:transcriptional regulator with XRE-family HTH domain